MVRSSQPRISFRGQAGGVAVVTQTQGGGGTSPPKEQRFQWITAPRPSTSLVRAASEPRRSPEASTTVSGSPNTRSIPSRPRRLRVRLIVPGVRGFRDDAEAGDGLACLPERDLGSNGVLEIVHGNIRVDQPGLGRDRQMVSQRETPSRFDPEDADRRIYPILQKTPPVGAQIRVIAGQREAAAGVITGGVVPRGPDRAAEARSLNLAATRGRRHVR